LSGQKEVAVLSRVELARLFTEQGKLDAAERLVQRTREEARRSRLGPLEAEAAQAQAELHLARGQAEAARKAALEAVSLADRYAGRPLLYRAHGALGDALARLGRLPESLDAYARSASTLDWIRGGLAPEDVASFVNRSDVQAFARRTASLLEKGGREKDAAPLRQWLGG
jgi:tetratricopeptide (TPR) repeat protein